MAKHLTTKEKCDKLAKMLEIVAVKLREPELGNAIWESEELAIQVLVSQVSTLLSRAKKITGVDSLQESVKKTSTKNNDKSEWPDIIS